MIAVGDSDYVTLFHLHFQSSRMFAQRRGRQKACIDGLSRDARVAVSGAAHVGLRLYKRSSNKALWLIDFGLELQRSSSILNSLSRPLHPHRNSSWLSKLSRPSSSFLVRALSLSRSSRRALLTTHLHALFPAIDSSHACIVACFTLAYVVWR